MGSEDNGYRDPSKDKSYADTLINIQYGVCFSVVFAMMFRVAPPDKTSEFVEVRLNFLNSKDGGLLYLSLTAYFLVDWLVANFSREVTGFSFSRALAVCVWLWFLGLITILSLGQNEHQALLLGCYMLGSAIYYSWNYSANVISESALTDQALIGAFICIPVFLISFYFIYISYIVIRGFAEVSPGELSLVLTVAVVSLAVLKLAHFFTLTRIDG